MQKLAIVIPTFNRKNSICRLLESIHHQILGNIKLSMIVVDDGSTDGTKDTIQKDFPDVHIIKGNSNWWWTKSVNEGCKWAIKNNNDTILLLNDDIELQKNYLQNLIHVSEKEPHAIIGSLNISKGENRIYFSGIKKYQWWNGKPQKYHNFLVPYKSQMSGLHKSVVLPGRGLLIPASVFQKIGFFDEKYLPQYKADYDFVLRANEKKIKTLISWDSIIYVHISKTGQGAVFTRQHIFKFFLSFFKKNSRTNLIHNFLYYMRHYPLWRLPLFPVTVFMIIMRQFFLFLKVQKY